MTTYTMTWTINGKTGSRKFKAATMRSAINIAAGFKPYQATSVLVTDQHGKTEWLCKEETGAK